MNSLLAELPVKERRLQLAGVSSALLEGGDGPPVLLLHGPGEFAALRARVIADLITTHRVVAPDLPGHGATGLTGGPLDHDRVFTWLGELIERTCATPPVVVGHLLGGAMAARFASERPDQLSRLVLVDSLRFGLCTTTRARRAVAGLRRTVRQISVRTCEGHCDRESRNAVEKQQ